MRPVVLFTCLLALGCSRRDQPAEAPAKPPLAIQSAGKAAALLIVTSPDFAAGAAIPDRFSDYGGKASPEIDWTGLPPGTKSLALIVEDPDAPGDTPFVHWLAWNIDPAAKGLARAGAPGTEGRNSQGGHGWFGPRPPAGPAHHYHFELFALDRPLDLSPGSDRGALLGAMDGHVLGKGELVGTFAAPGR